MHKNKKRLWKSFSPCGYLWKKAQKTCEFPKIGHKLIPTKSTGASRKNVDNFF